MEWDMKKLVNAVAVLGLLVAGTARAEGWCDLQDGWELLTHGNNSNTAYITGTFVGQTTARWIQINLPATGIGQSNVAMALAAKLAGKNVSLYLNGVNDTCANFANWSSDIRHMRIL
jgi:hypothetical protein